MCKYCEFDEEGLNDFEFNSYDNDTKEIMNLYKDSSGVAFICIENSATQPWFEINFCPMCGRNLNEEV